MENFFFPGRVLREFFKIFEASFQTFFKVGDELGFGEVLEFLAENSTLLEVIFEMVENTT